MEVLFGLLDNPLVLYGGGALIVFLLLRKFVLPKISGKSAKLPDADMLLSKLLGPRYADAKLERAVAAAKKNQGALAAGHLYEDAGKPQQAVDVYLEGQELNAAAVVLEKMGKLDRAAETYGQAGDYKKSAALYEKCGKAARAAVLFQEKGNSLEAARLYGVAGQWDKAADLYERSGYPAKAADAFEKCGNFAKAAASYERHFMENVSYSTTYSSTAVTPEQKSALLAGQLYEKAGDPTRAYNIYHRGGFFKEAAAVATSQGQHVKAAELFLRAEDMSSAADAYERAGDMVKAATFRGEVALKRDRVPEAARFFQEGQDYLRAAELFESIGMLAEAAGAYEAGESWAAAGSVYVRAGLKERAATSYERAGELETAAKLYEETGADRKATELYSRAGQSFKGGEAAFKSGDYEHAVSLLQRVAANDDNFRFANELLGQALIALGRPQLAVERLTKVLGGQAVSVVTLELCYWLGIAHERANQRGEALSIFKKVLAEDLAFRDAEAHARALEAGETPPPLNLRPPAPPAPATPPQPPAAPPAKTPATAAPRPAPTATKPTAAGHTPAPAPTPTASARFARHEELGRGPLGVVFRGEDKHDGKQVALRQLPPALLAAPSAQALLLADLKAAAGVTQPNIARVMGFVEIEGQKYVVSELIPGRTFAEALSSGRKLPTPQILSLAKVLAQALGAIHAKKLIHGSVQPSNVMVAQGVVKLVDFGLGRLAHTQTSPNDYRAPERQLDVAGDLYALAAVLYHLLTGVHPKAKTPLVNAGKLVPGVPAALDQVLFQSLQAVPQARLASAEQFLQILAKVSAGA